MDTIIAAVALFVSTISLIVAYRSKRHQIISTILSHLTEKSNEINNYIQSRLDTSTKNSYDAFTLNEADISYIGTNVVTTSQLLDLHIKKHEFYLLSSDKAYIINSYYLQLHVTIRKKLWEFNEDAVNDPTIRQQLKDSKYFLKDAKTSYK